MARINNPNANKAQILAKIRQEIQQDSRGRGYAGKTDAEVAYLLNVPLSDDQGIPSVAPRIHDILVGEGFAPNVIDAEDVEEARK